MGSHCIDNSYIDPYLLYPSFTKANGSLGMVSNIEPSSILNRFGLDLEYSDQMLIQNIVLFFLTPMIGYLVLHTFATEIIIEKGPKQLSDKFKLYKQTNPKKISETYQRIVRSIYSVYVCKVSLKACLEGDLQGAIYSLLGAIFYHAGDLITLSLYKSDDTMMWVHHIIAICGCTSALFNGNRRVILMITGCVYSEILVPFSTSISMMRLLDINSGKLPCFLYGISLFIFAILRIPKHSYYLFQSLYYNLGYGVSIWIFFILLPEFKWTWLLIKNFKRSLKTFNCKIIDDDGTLKSKSL
ncbi:hypothetical protein CYY_003960 [Polysphondylium violaceum]|uniref:TLC domain-containing protein n=1 Tax=Polysphondylium violaceum TaxID=133409 RepID=A0A8J4V0R9_9MYCE|nr:hypothetical protein CYY_003960 [Polysphondylium violaceum]